MNLTTDMQGGNNAIPTANYLFLRIRKCKREQKKGNNMLSSIYASHTRRLALMLAMGCGLALSGCDGETQTADATADSTVVKTSEGLVSGVALADVTVYKGIPYAAPPVGARRWVMAAAPAARDTTLEATKFAPACAQRGGSEGASSSEDCLYLNIWRPNGAKSESKLPVLVYMHGGAFTSGSGAEIDVSAFAKRNVVTVTFNYRLGALGNLANTAVRQANADSSSGNFALMDAVAALKWVQSNIASFGGDANNVTLWGFSAGATQAFSLVQSPNAKGVFQKAILESGGSAEYSNLTLDAALATGDSFVKKVGCDKAADVVACLRALPVASILAAQGSSRWRPTVDSAVVTQVPARAFESGNFNRVAMMIGGVFDDGSMFVDQTVNASSYRSALHSIVPADFETTQLDAAYPLLPTELPAQTYARAYGDAHYSCSNSARRETLAAWVPVYGWEFTDPAMSFPTSPKDFYLGTSHGMDGDYFFGSVEKMLRSPVVDAAVAPVVNSVEGVAQRKALSAQMQSYLTNFLRNGNPNGTTRETPAYWPQFGNAAQRNIMDFTLPASKATSNEFEKTHKCQDVWRNLLNLY